MGFFKGTHYPDEDRLLEHNRIKNDDLLRKEKYKIIFAETKNESSLWKSEQKLHIKL